MVGGSVEFELFELFAIFAIFGDQVAAGRIGHIAEQSNAGILKRFDFDEIIERSGWCVLVVGQFAVGTSFHRIA